MGVQPQTGTVYLVGAGPGNAGLITLRGVECLGRADVVLFDYLVNPQILKHVSDQCEEICLGQHGRTRIWRQDEINQRMVELAKAGKTVVRLKGGDPAVFARGADEASHLAANGIPFEVVPGITAALAANSYAGIPVTHRELASAVALVTGQEAQDAGKLDYDSLARFSGTLVVYMGVTTAQQWTAALIDAGKDGATPAAIIRRCSLPDQVVVHCQLHEVTTRLSESAIRPPVIVVIGEVAATGLVPSWFEQRPLFGTSVLVTRPQDQVEGLAGPLGEQGAEVLAQPAITITPPDDYQPVDEVLDRLADFDWLVFSSANGVRFLMQRLLERGRDARALAGVKLATVGPHTADELAAYHLHADLTAPEYRAESLASQLEPLAAGKRFLLARGSRGREVVAQRLQETGGQVEQVIVYASRDVTTPDPQVAQRLAAGTLDWITVTSSAIARSLAKMFGEDLKRTQIASISPLTSATLTELGFPPDAEATSYTMAGVVEAILAAKSPR